MSVKEIVLEVIQQMPADVTCDDVLEEIAVPAAIERGRQAAEAGRSMTQEEFEKQAARWTISK